MDLPTRVKSGQAPAVVGAVLILVCTLAGSTLPGLMEELLYLSGLVLLLLGFLLWARNKPEFDERFQVHRLKATRVAAVVGMVLLGIWFGFEELINDVFHWQILGILFAMATAKVGSMVYFQKRR